MADVKWIKITTDMFDNRKIKHLRRLPDGNSIVLIWVMLLTMAGRCNSGGMIFLTENIPYTPKMLADELDFEENTIILALDALERLGMVRTDDGFFTVAGWTEHQNIEGLDKIREQNRIRQANYKKKKKLLQDNVTDNVTVTSGNATEVEVEKEKEKEIRKRSRRSSSTATAAADESFSVETVENSEDYTLERIGGFLGKGVILMSEAQTADLLNKMSLDEYEYYVEKLADFIVEKNARVANHYKTILKWYREDKKIEGDAV